MIPTKMWFWIVGGLLILGFVWWWLGRPLVHQVNAKEFEIFVDGLNGQMVKASNETERLPDG